MSAFPEGECLPLRRKETSDPRFPSPERNRMEKVTYRSTAEAPPCAQPEPVVTMQYSPQALTCCQHSRERPGKTQKEQSAENAPTRKATGSPALRVATRRLEHSEQGRVSLSLVTASGPAYHTLCGETVELPLANTAAAFRFSLQEEFPPVWIAASHAPGLFLGSADGNECSEGALFCCGFTCL